MSGEKTHDPTAGRLKKAVEQGDVFQSRELVVALIFGAGVMGILALGPWLIHELKAMMTAALTIDKARVRDFTAGSSAIDTVLPVILPLLALIAIPALASLAAPAMLGSLGFNGAAVQFKASRINPATGLKRIFSVQGLTELGKALAKTVLVGGIGTFIIMRQIDRLGGEHAFDVAEQSRVLAADLALALSLLAAALVLIALIDVPAQYLLRRNRLRMTHQEFLDDHKQTEGSPELKAAVRRKQQEVLSRSVRAAMAEAHVVITNPSHFAVALRYDPERDAAPIIVARGCDAKAAAMRALAADSEAVLVSHPSLARAIYFTGREGQPIHTDLFRAVATVLAFVRQIDRLAEEDIQRMAPVPASARYDANGRLET